MSRIALTVIAVIFLAIPICAADPAKSLAFDKADAGKLPRGWTAAKTGEGEGSVWKVAADATAPSKSGFALAQTAEGPNTLFNLCVLEDSRFQDGELSVAIKAIAGKLDQGGGLVWRYRDAKNYYLCRYNPLEDNLRVYHVRDGKRTELATEEGIKLPAGEWFTVSISQKADAIECSLNGKKYLVVKDATFPDAGKVGVWSKADAQSHFDQFLVKPAK